MKTELSTVKLPVDLINRLKALKRPHQGIAGVIEELLLEAQKATTVNSEQPTKPVYETKPINTDLDTPNVFSTKRSK